MRATWPSVKDGFSTGGVLAFNSLNNVGLVASVPMILIAFLPPVTDL